MTASMLRIGAPSADVGFIPTVLSSAVCTGVIRVGGTRKGYDIARYDDGDEAEIAGESLYLHAEYFSEFTNYDPTVVEHHRNSFLEPKSLVSSGLGRFEIVQGLVNGASHHRVGNPLGYTDSTNAYPRMYGEFLQAIARVYNDFGVFNVPLSYEGSTGTYDLVFPHPAEVASLTGSDEGAFRSALDDAMFSFFISRQIPCRRMTEPDDCFPSGGGILYVSGHITGNGSMGKMAFQAFTQDPFCGFIGQSSMTYATGLSYSYENGGGVSKTTTSRSPIKYGLGLLGGDGELMTPECKAILAKSLFGLTGDAAKSAQIAESHSPSSMGDYTILVDTSWSSTVELEGYGTVSMRNGIGFTTLTPALPTSALSGYYGMLTMPGALFDCPLAGVKSGTAVFDLRNSWVPGADGATTRPPCTSLPGFVRVFSPSGPELIQIFGGPQPTYYGDSNVDLEIMEGILSMRIPVSRIKTHLEWMLSNMPNDAKLQEQISKLEGKTESIFGSITAMPLTPPTDLLSPDKLRIAKKIDDAGENILELVLSDGDPVVTMKSARNRINNLPPQSVWTRSSDVMEEFTKFTLPGNLAGGQSDYVISRGISYTGEFTEFSPLYLVAKADEYKNEVYAFNSIDDALSCYVDGFAFDETVPSETIADFLSENSINDIVFTKERPDGYDWKEFDPVAFCDDTGCPVPPMYVPDDDAYRRMWISYKGYNNSSLEKLFTLFARSVPE